MLNVLSVTRNNYTRCHGQKINTHAATNKHITRAASNKHVELGVTTPVHERCARCEKSQSES